MQDFNLKSTGHMGIEQLSQRKVHKNNVHLFLKRKIKCSSLRLLESKNKYVCPIKTYTIITIFLHKNIMALKWYILQVPKLSQMQKKQSTEPKSTKLKYLINIMLSIIIYDTQVTIAHAIYLIKLTTFKQSCYDFSKGFKKCKVCCLNIRNNELCQAVYKYYFYLFLKKNI